MNILLGIKLGLILTILVGPIFFSLIQAAVERGFRAGATMGLGIWTSDFLFILCAYISVSYVQSMLEGPYFSMGLGVLGSLVLLSFGLGTLLSHTPKIPTEDISGQKINKGSYLTLWLQGFLINTLNPFTIFFWVGVMTTYVVDSNWSGREATTFFAGILGTVVLTDLAKVALAKRIRRHLNPFHLLWLRRVSGSALIIFGFVLLFRVVFW